MDPMMEVNKGASFQWMLKAKIAIEEIKDKLT